MENFNAKKTKRYLIAGAILVMTVGTLTHFMYAWSGYNPLVGLFTPVNESTWEHMKMVFFPMLFYGLFLDSRHLPCVDPWIAPAILFGTWLIPVLFYTYSGILGKTVTVIDIAIFYISVLAAFLLLYHRAETCRRRPGTTILRIVIAGLAICFFLFSYAPPHLGIFAEP